MIQPRKAIAVAKARELLNELKILEPNEIDIDRIAFFKDAEIRYEMLQGMDGRIVREGKAAIITVSKKISYEGQRRFVIAHELGHYFLEHGQLDEAEGHIRKALEIKPNAERAHNNLGMCYLARGKPAESIVHFQRAVEINPRFAQAQSNLGSALLATGRTDEAIAHYLTALEGTHERPFRAGIENNLGGAFLLKRQVGEAVAHFEKAIEMEPRKVQALKSLAWVLATCPEAALRNGARAVALAERANQLSGGGDPLVLGTLSAAYAEAGRFPEAMETAGKALRSTDLKSDSAADLLRSQIRLYQTKTPFHEAYEIKP